MKLKEIHIWNFPEDRIKIRLRNQKDMLRNYSKEFGSLVKMSTKLGYKKHSVRSWIQYDLFLPLRFLNRLVNKLNLEYGEIEKKIVAYKGVNISGVIDDPILPIRVDSNFFGLITNLIGDGSINKNGIPIYTNKERVLLDNFLVKAKLVFGKNIPYKIYKNLRECYQIRIPQFTTDIISYTCPINFNSYTANIPGFLNLKDEYKIEIIRTILDDEGYVDFSKRIGIYMKSKIFMINIRKALIRLGINVTDLSKKDDGYYFYVKSDSLGEYKRIVGFRHPKKRMRLDLLLLMKNYVGFHRRTGFTRHRIINLLGKCGQLSVNDLVEKLKITRSNINMPLKQLEKEEIVERLEINHFNYWKLKEEN